jgi:hypothetical protein
MMGGWIDEVQIGYVGGKHSIQSALFLLHVDMNRRCTWKLHRMTSSQAELPSLQRLAWLCMQLHAAVLAFCISEID